jgi:hypothetical protein
LSNEFALWAPLVWKRFHDFDAAARTRVVVVASFELVPYIVEVDWDGRSWFAIPRSLVA